jgi:phosphate transport system permease protein
VTSTHQDPPPAEAVSASGGELDLSRLERSLKRPRTLFSFCMSCFCGGLTLLAAIPLFSVLIMLIWRGGSQFSVALFTELPPAAGMLGGGIGNAIVGTLLVVLIAAGISIPIGVCGGIYVAEIDPDSRVSAAVRFCAKLLTGLPSILAGVFAYSAVVLATGRFSPLAGGVALAVLMLPIILLTTEEAIRAVSPEMRQAAIGMGATQTQLVWHISLPSALPGILTGVMLALSRAAGETAPLLFTMTFSDYWLSTHLLEPTASLAVLIFNFSKSPFENQKAFAWAASLVLVLIALCLNLGGRALARRAART